MSRTSVINYDVLWDRIGNFARKAGRMSTEVDKKGVIGVAESSNTYIDISLTKDGEEGKEGEQ